MNKIKLCKYPNTITNHLYVLQVTPFSRKNSAICGFLAIVSHLHFAAVIIRTRNKINFHDKAHTNTEVSVGRLETRGVFHVSQSSTLFIIQEQYSTYTRICIRSVSWHFKEESNEIFWSGQTDRSSRNYSFKGETI